MAEAPTNLEPFRGWTAEEVLEWTNQGYYEPYRNASYTDSYSNSQVSTHTFFPGQSPTNYPQTAMAWPILCPPKTQWQRSDATALIDTQCVKIKVGLFSELWWQDENNYKEFNRRQCPAGFTWNDAYKACFPFKVSRPPQSPVGLPYNPPPRSPIVPPPRPPVVPPPPPVYLQPAKPAAYKNRPDLLKEHVRAVCNVEKPLPAVVDTVAAGTAVQRYCCDVPEWPGLGDLYELLADGRGGTITKLVQRESPYCQNPPPTPPPPPPPPLNPPLVDTPSDGKKPPIVGLPRCPPGQILYKKRASDNTYECRDRPTCADGSHPVYSTKEIPGDTPWAMPLGYYWDGRYQCFRDGTQPSPPVQPSCPPGQVAVLFQGGFYQCCIKPDCAVGQRIVWGFPTSRCEDYQPPEPPIIPPFVPPLVDMPEPPEPPIVPPQPPIVPPPPGVP